MSDESLGEFWNRAAADYDDVLSNSPIRQYCRLPAVQALMPPVDGKRVLEAACGTGVDAAWLAEQGATVLGVDSSEEMVRTAEDRFGAVAEFKQADLREPMEFLADRSFDVVSSQLTLSHLADWETVLSEFNRVLTEDGVLVVSTDHPFRQFLLARDGEFSDLALYPHMDVKPEVLPENDPANYYELEEYDLALDSEESQRISFYRRPMSTYFQSFLDAGFALDDVVEPMFTDEFREESPAVSERFLHAVPDFLCLKASKS